MADNTQNDSYKLVNAIMDNKNINAHKELEKILQKKCAKKIKETLSGK